MGNDSSKGNYARMGMARATTEPTQADQNSTNQENGTKENMEHKVITEFGDTSDERSAASEKIVETFSMLNNGYQILSKKSQMSAEHSDIPQENLNENAKQISS